jgi:hypothetical protein
MPRPRATKVQRVRVELRLNPAVAARLYDWASGKNHTVSEAGALLIERGLVAAADTEAETR